MTPCQKSRFFFIFVFPSVFPLYFLGTLNLATGCQAAQVENTRKYKGNTVGKHKNEEKSRFLAWGLRNIFPPAKKYHLLTCY